MSSRLRTGTRPGMGFFAFQDIITRAAWDQVTLGQFSAEERAALELSAKRIEAFYRKQPVTSWVTQEMGGVLGQLIRPAAVGCWRPAAGGWSGPDASRCEAETGICSPIGPLPSPRLRGWKIGRAHV